MALLTIVDFTDLLLPIVAGAPASPAAAAEQYAEAYYQYVKGHQFGPNPKVLDPLLQTKRDALKGTLEAGMLLLDLPAIALPNQFADAWASGLTAFWSGTTVTGTTQNGTSAAPTLSPAPQLLLLFSVLLNTHETVAAGMAAALDASTRTVQATVTPPSGTVLTIA